MASDRDDFAGNEIGRRRPRTFVLIFGCRKRLTLRNIAESFLEWEDFDKTRGKESIKNISVAIMCTRNFRCIRRRPS